MIWCKKMNFFFEMMMTRLQWILKHLPYALVGDDWLWRKGPWIINRVSMWILEHVIIPFIHVFICVLSTVCRSVTDVFDIICKFDSVRLVLKSSCKRTVPAAFNVQNYLSFCNNDLFITYSINIICDISFMRH